MIIAMAKTMKYPGQGRDAGSGCATNNRHVPSNSAQTVLRLTRYSGKVMVRPFQWGAHLWLKLRYMI
jgi:hypothetical protein